MGRRNRERVQRIRRGEDISIRDWAMLEKLERVTAEFSGVLVAEEIEKAGQEGRLKA